MSPPRPSVPPQASSSRVHRQHTHPPRPPQRGVGAWVPAVTQRPPRRPRSRVRAGINTLPLPRNWPQLVVWIALDVSFLLLGAITAFVAFAWLPSSSESSPKSTSFPRTLVLSRLDLIAALVLGAVMCAIFLWSIPAILQSKYRTSRLFVFNWLLVVAGLLVIAAGSIIWFRTLRERALFGAAWTNIGPQGQAMLQDTFHCCGYWNLTDAVPSNFCPGNISTDTALAFCVDSFTNYADGILNKLFTLIYAYMAIIILLFFATCCVMVERRLRERFDRIDQKRQTLLFA